MGPHGTSYTPQEKDTNMAPAVKKNSFKKMVKKTTTKVSAKVTAKKSVRTATKKQSEKFAAMNSKFVNDLAKLPNVKIMTRAESEKFFTENDFHGCLVVPKSTATNPDQEVK